MFILNLLIKNNLTIITLYIYKVLVIKILFFIFIIEQPLANDVKIQLKEIEKKLEKNKALQNILKKKQKKIDASIKAIEKNLKKNEKKIKGYFAQKELTYLKIKQNKEQIKSIEQNLYILRENKRDLIHTFIKNYYKANKTLKNYEKIDSDIILVNIYKNALEQARLNNKKLKETRKTINIDLKKITKLDNKLEYINKNLLENSNLETTLQGENLITLIQKKEKELENIEITQKAEELKKLIESLKITSKTFPRKKATQRNNLKKIENILPINFKNIEKIRTDVSKKGILLTLKEKSFLTTPLDGLVVYADSFKGYGNMVIIDLGENYHIIYSGLTNIMCSVGDWLKAGNILGEIEMKYKINEVYLEVRFKGKTLDPSSWLKS